jgi:methylthioribose-1-phosphate isomerase
MKPIRAIEWVGGVDGHLRLIDQTLLPANLAFRECRSVEAVWEAIRNLRVRGAPAIGVAAAFGLVIGLQQASPVNVADFAQKMEEVASYLATSRPTAINLFWALDRMQRQFATQVEGSPRAALEQLLGEARAIFEEDRRMCEAIGRHGAQLVPDGGGVLTHCNTGQLATAGLGTALAIFYTANHQGKRFRIYADETRPLLQGARLTSWELDQAGLDVTLICDSAAAQVMKEGKIQAVFVGADRIAANGDTANKVGTYGVALLAKAHQIPFYVAAPFSSFDLTLADGNAIPIEQRDPHEVRNGFGKQTVPDAVPIYNPAFDVTPNQIIAGIVTEKGLIQPVSTKEIVQMASHSRP